MTEDQMQEAHRSLDRLLAFFVARGEIGFVHPMLKRAKIDVEAHGMSPFIVGKVVCQSLSDFITVRAQVEERRSYINGKRRRYVRLVSLWSVLSETIFKAVGAVALCRSNLGRPFWLAEHGGSIAVSRFSRSVSDAVFAASMYDPEKMEVLSLCVAGELSAENLTDAKVCSMAGFGPLEDRRFAEGQKCMQRLDLSRSLLNLRKSDSNCHVLPLRELESHFNY